MKLDLSRFYFSLGEPDRDLLYVIDHNEFKTYVMYLPPGGRGSPSSWVPLLLSSWSDSSTAGWTGKAWVFEPTLFLMNPKPGDLIFARTSEEPKWTFTVQGGI